MRVKSKKSKKLVTVGAPRYVFKKEDGVYYYDNSWNLVAFKAIGDGMDFVTITPGGQRKQGLSPVAPIIRDVGISIPRKRHAKAENSILFDLDDVPAFAPAVGGGVSPHEVVLQD